MRPTALHALLPSSPTPPLRPTSSPALTPSGRGAVACAANGVAGLPAVVAAADLEADVVAGPHPLRARRCGALGQRRCMPSCHRRRRPCGQRPGRPSPPPGEAPCCTRPMATEALLPSSSPPPPLKPPSSTAFTPSGRGAVSRATDGVAGPPAVVAVVANTARELLDILAAAPGRMVGRAILSLSAPRLAVPLHEARRP